MPRCRLDETPLEERDDDPLIGRRLDRYRILELLGSGGMGRVYRAAHEVIAREYAIKVLFGDFAGEPQFAERFRREARSISRMRHPNIVAVEDFGRTAEGLTFIALELVRGRPLQTYLAERGPLSVDEATRLVRQIVEGLGAAHAAGFVHRDVKPQNLMVGPDGRVKILDFGSVSLLAPPPHERLTVAGHIVGTPGYMAPEQSQDEAVGPEADFYAVGVVLYEMLTGELPFRGRTRAEILVKHIAEPPPELPPSGGLERVVSALLEKRAQLRPSKAEDVLAMLDDLPITGPSSIAQTWVDERTGATQTILVPAPTTADLDDERPDSSAEAPSPAATPSHPWVSTPSEDPTPSAASPVLEPQPAASPAPTPVVDLPPPRADTVPSPTPSRPGASAVPTETSPDARGPAFGPGPRPLAASLALAMLAMLALVAFWYWSGDAVRIEPVPPRSVPP